MKYNIKILIVLLTIAIIITQCACTEKGNEPVSDTRYDLLNTTCSIAIYDSDISEKDALAKINAAFDVCDKYEKLVSKSIEESEIYKLNHANGEAVSLSDETFALLEKGIYYGELSDGRFDITIGRLSELWDFSSNSPSVPAATSVAAAVKTVDYHQLVLQDGTASLISPLAQVDLGGIAKGYIADRVSDYLSGEGIESALINLGGNIVALGSKPDGSPWKIGVEKPFSGQSNIIGSVEVTDKTLVTSGIYERMFKTDGKIYHHVLDVKTGYPADTEAVAVTIIADAGCSVDCDALSTTCLLMSISDGLALIESIDGVEALFVNNEDEISLTSGMNFTPAQ